MVLYIVIPKVSYIRVSIKPVFFYNDIKVNIFKRVVSVRVEVVNNGQSVCGRGRIA